MDQGRARRISHWPTRRARPEAGRTTAACVLTLLCAWCLAGVAEAQTGKVYPLEGDNGDPVYTFERVSHTVGRQTTVEVWFRDLEGNDALYEKVIYDRGRVVRCDSYQNQVGEHYVLHVADGRAVFSISRDDNTSRSEEAWTPNTVIIDELPEYIRHHWDTLMRGDDLQIRFVVMFRGETVGFTIYKERTTTWNDQPAVAIRLKPSNFFIALFVRPVELIFRDDDRKTLLETVGRLPVKKRQGSKWVDFSGRLVWQTGT